MNIYQAVIVLFGIVAAATSIWAIIAVIRSARLTLKPLWVIGCAIGVVGLGLDWTSPDDLVLLVGLTIPPVMVIETIATGQVIVKTGFPVVAVAALVRVRSLALAAGAPARPAS